MKAAAGTNDHCGFRFLYHRRSFEGLTDVQRSTVIDRGLGHAIGIGKIDRPLSPLRRLDLFTLAQATGGYFHRGGQAHANGDDRRGHVGWRTREMGLVSLGIGSQESVAAIRRVRPSG